MNLLLKSGINIVGAVSSPPDTTVQVPKAFIINGLSPFCYATGDEDIAPTPFYQISAKNGLSMADTEMFIKASL